VLGVAARGLSSTWYVHWACLCPAGRERGHDQLPQRTDQLALSDQDGLAVGADLVDGPACHRPVRRWQVQSGPLDEVHAAVAVAAFSGVQHLLVDDSPPGHLGDHNPHPASVSLCTRTRSQFVPNTRPVIGQGKSAEPDCRSVWYRPWCLWGCNGKRALVGDGCDGPSLGTVWATRTASAWPGEPRTPAGAPSRSGRGLPQSRLDGRGVSPGPCGASAAARPGH
jgi:hypothetical protein